MSLLTSVSNIIGSLLTLISYIANAFSEISNAKLGILFVPISCIANVFLRYRILLLVFD